MAYILIIQLLIIMAKDVLMQKTYSTPINNSPLFPRLLKSLSRQKHTPMTTTSIKHEYDYIVVGGGASGSVIASRLSEEPCVSVLLLEAGPEPPLLTEVPALNKYFLGTDVDWQLKTVPQKHAAEGLENRQIPWSAGKMLGGSASLNGMGYVRGNKMDYDYWESIGAIGWSYKHIFRYFLKLEDNRSPAFLNNGYHATGGPITVEQPRYQPELKEAASLAAVKMGYQFVDSNGAKQTGFYDLQANYRDNQRCSPVKGYLVPADHRRNLDISVNSFVTRVIFKNRRAAAVEFFNGKYQQVMAKRDIIITAGAVNTPKILMLSGVGPKEELNKFNISVVADLPVGKNFHDHCASIYYFTLDPSIRSFAEKLSDSASISQYITYRSGPLSSASNVLIAFLYGMNTTTPLDFPNFQISLGEFDYSLSKTIGLKQEIFKSLFGPHENKAMFRCTSTNLHIRSRGAITLNSSNPFDPPLIDPNYLEDPRDLEDIVDGLKFCKKLITSEPLFKLGAKPLQSMPRCEKYAYNEDEYFRCYARTYTYTYHHIAGSAKMGDPSDSTTVVDPELRVKGVKGLRVADASVMPQVPSGNTHIPVLMVAEKASDIIKGSITCTRKNKH